MKSHSFLKKRVQSFNSNGCEVITKNGKGFMRRQK